jgi:hypothetical protein
VPIIVTGSCLSPQDSRATPGGIGGINSPVGSP